MASGKSTFNPYPFIHYHFTGRNYYCIR
ncbi:hypothetical protein KKC1_17310, partial [Calderihabitans maritimus]